jgi:hypothetical protein
MRMAEGRKGQEGIQGRSADLVVTEDETLGQLQDHGHVRLGLREGLVEPLEQRVQLLIGEPPAAQHPNDSMASVTVSFVAPSTHHLDQSDKFCAVL